MNTYRNNLPSKITALGVTGNKLGDVEDDIKLLQLIGALERGSIHVSLLRVCNHEQ